MVHSKDTVLFVEQRISTKNIYEYTTKIFSSAIIQSWKRIYTLTMSILSWPPTTFLHFLMFGINRRQNRREYTFLQDQFTHIPFKSNIQPFINIVLYKASLYKNSVCVEGGAAIHMKHSLSPTQLTNQNYWVHCISLQWRQATR